MHPEHWDAVRTIYSEGIATGQATFETEVSSWETWDAGHLGAPRLIARQGLRIVGWAALSPVSTRCVYGGVAEVSIYVGNGNRAKGIGTVLLSAMIEASGEHGIWTLQASMFPENRGSVHLLRKLGFREVGVRERLGKLQGRWRDVLLLERRSDDVGVE
ncbi:GNAT family N-acetyltransferase [soil metagenome]